MGYASSGLPGPKGNRETFVWLAEPGARGVVDDLEAAACRGRADRGGRVSGSGGFVATVVTHRRPEETAPAVAELIEVARRGRRAAGVRPA